MNIEIGAKIRVRLPDGDKADGTIQGKTAGNEFLVATEDEIFVLSGSKPRKSTGNEFYDRVRLLYPVEQMESYKARLK